MLPLFCSFRLFFLLKTPFFSWWTTLSPQSVSRFPDFNMFGPDKISCYGEGDVFTRPAKFTNDTWIDMTACMPFRFTPDRSVIETDRIMFGKTFPQRACSLRSCDLAT